MHFADASDINARITSTPNESLAIQQFRLFWLDIIILDEF